MMQWNHREPAAPLFHAGRRFFVISLVLALGFTALVVRAVQLHISAQPVLEGVASQQYHAVVPMTPKRGKVLDSKGRELATSVPTLSVFADPSGVTDVQATVSAIEEILPLGKARAEVVQRMGGSKRFAWIKRRVPLKVAEKVRDLHLAGVHFIEESERFYPNEALGSQIVGVVSKDAEALSGVELAYDRYLRNASQQVVYERDARGRTFFTPDAGGISPTLQQGTVQLTIDKVIQYLTEQALGKAVEKAKAKGGMAIVADPQTGKILAMANMPTFNPNQYWQYPQDAWRNRAITDMAEPGSTFKVLVLSAAVEAGIPPDRKFDCAGGAITIGKAVLHDSHSHGILSLADILRVSSNIGTVKIAQVLGKERVGAALTAFGIGQKTGIDFPGEAAGIMRPAGRWQPLDMATMAFGQGVAVTPIQMAMVFATIANNGLLMKPYLVEEVRDGQGAPVFAAQPTVVRHVMSASTAETMRSLLSHVVEPGGTGVAAASALYRTAGKTGTAQKVQPGQKGYAPGKYFSSFVGFAPLDRPQIVVYVGLDEPVGAYYGGVIAAPVFREIVEGTLQYLEVPTTGVPIITADTASPDAVADIASPGDGAIGAVMAPGSNGKPVAVGSAVAPASVRRFVPGEGNRLQVPALAGLSVREVMRAAEEAQMLVKVSGVGVAVAQRPAAGSLVGRNDTVEIDFQLPE